MFALCHNFQLNKFADFIRTKDNPYCCPDGAAVGVQSDLTSKQELPSPPPDICYYYHLGSPGVQKGGHESSRYPNVFQRQDKEVPISKSVPVQYIVYEMYLFDRKSF